VDNYLQEKIAGLVKLTIDSRIKQSQAVVVRKEQEDSRKLLKEITIKRREQLRVLEKTTRAVRAIDLHESIVKTDWCMVIWYFKLAAAVWSAMQDEKTRRMKSFRYIKTITLMQRWFRNFLKHGLPPIPHMPFRQTKLALLQGMTLFSPQVKQRAATTVMAALGVVYRTMRLRRDMSIFALNIKNMTKRLTNHMVLKYHMINEMRMLWDREVKRLIDIDQKRMLTGERLLTKPRKIESKVKNLMVDHFFELELLKYMKRKVEKWISDRNEDMREKKMLRRMTVMKVLKDMHREKTGSFGEILPNTKYA